MKTGTVPGVACALLLAATVPASSSSVASKAGRPAAHHRSEPGRWAPGEEPPAGLTRGDWTQIRQKIAASSYHASAAPKPRRGSVLQASNRQQRYDATFRRDGIELASEASVTVPWRLGLAVTGYGYDGDVRPLEDADPRADKERVEYRRGPVKEWYVNRPAGLEQGFELQEPRPRRRGPLVVAMAVRGDLDVLARDGATSFADRSGNVLLRYAGLAAWDADGRPLGSRVKVADRQIRLVVDAQAARFPVTVDPTFVHEAQFLGHGDQSELAGTGFGCAVAVEGDTVAIGAFNEPGAPGPAVGAAYVFVRFGTFWALQQKLVAPDPSFSDQFGWSISLSGDTVVVGSPFDDDNGAGVNDLGSAYVFVRSGTTWTLQQKLLASDGTTGDQLGWRVSISGDTVVAGAPFDDVSAQTDMGSAYVFVRAGGVWTEQQRLSPSDGAAGDSFASSVSVAGDTLVAGSPQDDTVGGADAGSAYVMVRSGTTWSEQQKLLASDGAASDSFGFAVSIFGDTAVVGAPDEQSSQGAAYVFVRSGTTWTEQQKLQASDGAASDAFGTSVSVWGDTLVAGAPFDTSVIGAAYVFVRSGTTWTEQQKLLSGGGGIDFFGVAVSVYADTAVGGAHASGVGVGFADAFVRSGTTWTMQQKLLPPFVTALDEFAQSVSVSGDTVVVGAPLDDTPLGADAGSAYVFFKSGGIWTEQQFLQPSDGAADDNFGYSVSVDGDTAVVGSRLDDTAAGADAGSAYVFVRSGTTWTEQQKLTASDAVGFDRFGVAVAVSGDTVVVGAPRHDTAGGADAGTAYVFVRSGTVWTEQQKLEASDAATDDTLGFAVSASGDTAAVGAPSANLPGAFNAGAAYVFVRSGTTWSEQQKLEASDAAASDLFATSISISGDTVVAGNPFHDTPGGADAGSAYVFVRSGTVWGKEQQLVASDGIPGERFGSSVSVSGNTAVVGAPSGDTPAGADAGAAYVFVRAGTTWTEQSPKLLAPDGAAGDGFASKVALDGDLAAIGAPLDDTAGGADSGSVHVFRRSSIFDLGATKTDGQTTAAPGQQLTYTMVVSNAGPEDAVFPIVTDVVPAALLGATWTCSATPGSSCTPSGSGNINDAITLLVGGTATYILTGTVDPTATGTLSNTVTVTPPFGSNDPNPANNSATDTDTLAPEADVAVAKTDTPDPVLPGGALTYVVTVSNLGPSNATAVTMTDTLPSGVTFVSSVPPPPTCVLAGPTLTCNLGTVAGGGTSTVTINTTVNATGGILVNSASVSATEPDPTSGNNSASASTGVGVKDGELRHGFEEMFDLAALPGPVTDEDVFRISQKPYSSYEIVVDATSGDIGPAGPVLERIGPDGSTVLQPSTPVGAGPSRSLRWSNTTASEVEDEAIRVRSVGCGTDCGVDDVYRIRAYETTYSAPRFNNSGTQVTVLILQNPTNYAVTGEVYFRNTSGVLVATQPFSLGPKAALVLNTSTIPGAGGASGAITVAHDGRYGDLFGKTVALEPATGFSFDSALDARPK